MNKGVLIWGYFSSFILLLGAIFMNMNLVAGKVLYLTGFFSFNLGYLIPLFLLIFRKNQENKIGLVLIFGILGFLCFLTGVSFYVVNWGGGIVLIYTGGGILILAILTIIGLSRRFYETNIDSWFPVLVFGVFIVVSLLTGMVHRHVMRVFSVNNKDSIYLLDAVNQKNKQLYATLTPDTNAISFNYDTTIQRIALIQNSIHQTNEFIETIKLSLISEVKGTEYKLFDVNALDNLVPVQSNVEINAVRRLMLKKHKGKAYQLKVELINLRKILRNQIPAGEDDLIKFINQSLNTDSYDLGKRRHNKTWEYQNFYNFPLVTVLNQLSHIQLKIAWIESELLHYYIEKNSFGTSNASQQGTISSSLSIKPDK